MALFGGNNDQELNVTIRAKDEASQSLNKVNMSLGKLAGGFAVGTLAVDAFRAGFRFLSGVVTDSLKEFEEANAATAQLNAVLKSTQHAAGLTAKELTDMADALAKNTLYQDEAIVSAENMLLTFTKIGKDVFPQAIETVLDMSTALGQDLKSSAIQLGKALNNPIEGVSALQRVGVSFSNAQQEVIETMVKSGQTADAQRFILKELQTEFGGSAKSAYEAASSITKLQKNMSELKEGIGKGLTPAINNLFNAFAQVSEGMGENVDVGRVTFKVFATIGEVAASAAAAITLVSGALIKMASYAGQTLSVIGLFDSSLAESFEKQRDGARAAEEATVNFFDKLRETNKQVLDSWDEMSTDAAVTGRVAADAYEMTGDEAEAAAKKVESVQKAIADTKSEYEDFQKALRGDTQDLAGAFVEQEQKVRDIEKEIREENKKPEGEFDNERLKELVQQLQREKGALERARGIEQQLPNEIADERRRSQLTPFERNVEDIQKRIAERRDDFTQGVVMNFTFNGAVAGDAGIKKIIADTMNELNRAAALKLAGQ